MKKVLVGISATLAILAFVATMVAWIPPGQKGYDGQPGNQGGFQQAGQKGYEGQPGNQGGHH